MSAMPLREQTLGDLARHCDAVLRGEPTCVIRGVAALGEARPDEISFLANSRYQRFLESTRAAAVILAPAHADDCPVPCLIGDNPDLLRARVVDALYTAPAAVAGVHASAVLGKDVQIDPTAEIAAGCMLGDLRYTFDGRAGRPYRYPASHARCALGEELCPPATSR